MWDPEATFAVRASADVDKPGFSICRLTGTSRQNSRPQPAQGWESNRG